MDLAFNQPSNQDFLLIYSAAQIRVWSCTRIESGAHREKNVPHARGALPNL